MGGGGGPTLEASLSTERNFLAGTTAGSFAIFGFSNPRNSTVDTYDGSDNLERKLLNYGGPPRSDLAATSVTCGNDSYALFGGGSDGSTYNDVDIFKCNDDGVFNDQPLMQFKGAARTDLAATSVSNTNDSYALFGGGHIPGVGSSCDVDIFKCNDDGLISHHTLMQLGQKRRYVAATTVSNTNDSYALFGGGKVSDTPSLRSNDVDIFKCNDDGVFNDQPLMQFKGALRSGLAATTVSYGNDSYALFGGGFLGGTGGFSNDVDIFKCNDNGVFNDHPLMHFKGIPRYYLAATTVSYGNASYALFGGGSYGSTYSNDVDIFICNDDGVFYHKLIQFNGPPRRDLAATTVKVDGKEYALFAGGKDDTRTYNTIDIYDSETQEFSPL